MQMSMNRLWLQGPGQSRRSGFWQGSAVSLCSLSRKASAFPVQLGAFIKLLSAGQALPSVYGPDLIHEHAVGAVHCYGPNGSRCQPPGTGHVLTIPQPSVGQDGSLGCGDECRRPGVSDEVANGQAS